MQSRAEPTESLAAKRAEGDVDRLQASAQGVNHRPDEGQCVSVEPVRTAKIELLAARNRCRDEQRLRRRPLLDRCQLVDARSGFARSCALRQALQATHTITTIGGMNGRASHSGINLLKCNRRSCSPGAVLQSKQSQEVRIERRQRRSAEP